MHGVMSIAPYPHISNTRYTHKENSLKQSLISLVGWPRLSCLLFLPWCTAIAGYHTSSNNSNSQQESATNVPGFWKTDQFVTLGLFHFIGSANNYKRTLTIHSPITRPG